MPKLKQITPLVPVVDVRKSVEFFEKVLGFETAMQSEIYAYIQRDDVAIRLQKAGDNIGEQACYIDVDDVDTLYAELKPELDKLPAGQVRAPFDQDYGQREFHVIDLDSLLIFFGESIDNNKP